MFCSPSREEQTIYTANVEGNTDICGYYVLEMPRQLSENTCQL